MIDLANILKKATEGVEERYFQLKIDGGLPIYRERVYCYELYHQLRKNWTRTDYVINGEVDKSAHPIMEPLGARKRKPDLLIHGPGNMAANYAIIEVKPSLTNSRGIRKDLETLSFFRGPGRYKCAILLLYGFEACKVAKSTIALCKQQGDFNEIEIWVHKNPNAPAKHVATVGGGNVTYSI